MTCGFLIQLVFCKKKTMWFIGVELGQETSAPPPKKNLGSAPAISHLRYSKMSNINRQLVLQNCCKMSWITMLCILSSTNQLKYFLQQINWTVFVERKVWSLNNRIFLLFVAVHHDNPAPHILHYISIAILSIFMIEVIEQNFLVL